MVEVACLSVGAGLLVFALIRLFGAEPVYTYSAAVLVSMGVFAIRYRQLQLHRLSEGDIAVFLNRRAPQLEDSTDLLIADPEALRPLQLLQRQRLLTTFERAAQQIRWPEQWRRSLLVLGLGMLAVVVVGFIGYRPEEITINNTPLANDSKSQLQATVTAAELEGHKISVRPPAYTGLGMVHSEDFNLRVPEGSRINWQLTFSGAPERVMMIFSNGDSSLPASDNNIFTLSRTAGQSGFYSITWQDRGTPKSSDFYKLEVIEDQPPKVAIDDQEQFLEFAWQEEIEVDVRSSISDDYGITEAYVIATVSKGSGESVKFREERLPFVRPRQFAGRHVEATLNVNTKKLGMEPGDELYYYVEAWDNHSPQRQSNRTETYFIQIRDTATQMISFEGGMSVDLMPEYFRSQRQIIIDSEKLLAEKAGLEKKEFDRRSNDLAHDQKVLRLRYGQFLGEEFESGMTAETEMDEPQEAAPENAEEVVKRFGHAHDTDNEHNLVAEHDHEHSHAHEHGHEHEHEGGDPGTEDEETSPIEAFAHFHDNMEEATFFIQSVKTKLRAALSMMWDAELHLRMNNPAESLPYQYKILKLLKEISQDSRIYVHRTGFDAPPLKEEKRLSGELDEVRSARSSYFRSGPDAYPSVRAALPLVETLILKLPTALSSEQQEILLAAGNELAAAAVEQPDLYLARLTALRAVLDGTVTEKNLRSVRAAFWTLLPALPRSAAGKQQAAYGLQDAFIQQLKAQRYR
jgi:hypothetical protein